MQVTFATIRKTHSMPLDSQTPNVHVSRQKFAEVKAAAEEIKLRQNAFRKMLREGRLLSLTKALIRRLGSNLESAVRMQGGLRNTIRQSVSELKRSGPKGFVAKIYRRLGAHTEFEPLAEQPARASLYDNTAPYQFKPTSDYEALYQNYLDHRTDQRKIAIFRAVTGDYDAVLPYEHYLADADYFTFTDTPTSVRSLNLPVPYFDASPTRRARFVKLHPHMLFPDHDVAVWHDGNVMIREDITPLIEAVLSSGLPIGTFFHPTRSDVYDEAKACIEQNKDNADTILSQIERYSEEGFLTDQLVESNFVIYNLRHPELRDALTCWWAELDRGSYRDQLSFNYAVDSAKTAFLPLAQRPTCVRNYPAFAFFSSHGDEGRRADADNATKPEFDLNAIATTRSVQTTADVLVCVHNALGDVKDCLGSVVRNGQDSVQNIIIVDDGSEEETRRWLEQFASSHDNVVLHRNDKATGYTKAANKAISLSTVEHVVLLNSDAIVGARAIRKMLACMTKLEGCGIVGPLSNAASYQSIPHHLSGAGQTAVNALPTGYSVDDMDAWCAQNALGLPAPGVPFVHGFCMCIERDVFEKIGVFDEVAFPFGYGEENDFCIRAAENGFRLNIAIDAFVFHAKSKSYSNNERRKSLMTAGSAKLCDMHGTDRLNRLIQSMQNNPTLAQMRDRALKLYS